MQNIMNNASSLLANIGRQSSCAQLQFVRWRKPRWVPVAKSKMFLVRHKVWPPEAEMKEKLHLKNQYATAISSIRKRQKYINYVLPTLTETRDHAAIINAEINLAIEENAKINAEVLARRQKIDEENWIELEKSILMKKKELEQQEEEQLKDTEEELLQQIDRLQYAIKIEDLDEVINKALSVETDYNYAVDKYGNIYSGRYNNGQISQGGKEPSTVIEPLRVELSEKVS